MPKYLVYNKNSGAIYRELDQYYFEEDGTLVGGINGQYTLRYLPATSPAVLEVSEEFIAEIGDQYNNYRIVNGSIVESEDLRVELETLKAIQAEQEEINIAQDDALIELYEMIGG